VPFFIDAVSAVVGHEVLNLYSTLHVEQPLNQLTAASGPSNATPRLVMNIAVGGTQG
jgi:hypothetical protein